MLIIQPHENAQALVDVWTHIAIITMLDFSPSRLLKKALATGPQR